MFRRYAPREKADFSPVPPFYHDPNFILFRSWTAVLSLEGTIPEENPAGETALFLDENPEAYGTESIPALKPVGLKNPTPYAHLTVTIVCARTGKEVFYAKEMPAGGRLHMEFLREGSFTLHYSPAFSQANLRRVIRIISPIRKTFSEPHNFQPELRPQRWWEASFLSGRRFS